MARFPLPPIVCLLLLSAVFVAPAGADPVGTPVAAVGAIRGSVVDDSGLPIPGATLVLTCPASPGTREATSGEDGTFHFDAVPPGECEVTAKREGFGTARIAGVRVVAEQTTIVSPTLRASADEIVVSATMSKDFLQRIPSGRSYQNAVSPVAGVVGGRGWSGPARPPREAVVLVPGVPGQAAAGPLPTGQDQYAAIAENPFQVTSDTPLSTFAIDVDTASYTNVRRYLTEGQLPPRDAVRIEELVNYFGYTYPAPRDGEPFAVATEVTDAPWADGHRLVRVGIHGREVPRGDAPPLNLVFLVDVSGSMGTPDRLPVVRRGLDLLARQLGPRDHVAVVTYAGAAGVALPPTRGDDTETILAAIDRLGAGGSTAGAAGIRTAYQLAGRNFQDGAVNRVILATDGDFNVGVSSEGELLQLIEKERESGVFLTVLGVGRGNLQDAKMEMLADHGNGNYAYVDGYDEMVRVLRDEGMGTLVPIAKDVKIQVEFNPAQVSAWRLVGYENRALAARDFADDRKDAGEVGAGHTVTALYEIVPAGERREPEVAALRYQAERAPTEAAWSGELLDLRLRYKEPDGETSRLVTFPVRDEGTPFARASADTRWAAAVAGFGMLLRDSPNKGELDWGWVRRTAQEASGEDTRGDRAEFVGLVERARRLGAVAQE